MPSVDEMTKDERKLFDQIVEEQVKMSNLDEEEEAILAETLTDFFDESSETYNDIEAAQEELEREIITSSLNGETNDTNLLQSGLGAKEVNAFSIRLGRNFVGHALNIAIGFAVGGGVGAIQAFMPL